MKNPNAQALSKRRMTKMTKEERIAVARKGCIARAKKIAKKKSHNVR